MTKGVLVIFSILAAIFVGEVSNAQTQDPAPAVNSTTPPSSGNEDSIEGQTKRVTGDQVLLKILKPFEKKYHVRCQIPTSDDAVNENPKWTCLNNNACSYKVDVSCFETRGAHRLALQLAVEGFDDGTNDDIQYVQVTYLLK